MLFPESCFSEKNMKTTKLWPWAKGKIIWAYEVFRKIQILGKLLSGFPRSGNHRGALNLIPGPPVSYLVLLMNVMLQMHRQFIVK